VTNFSYKHFKQHTRTSVNWNLEDAVSNPG